MGWKNVQFYQGDKQQKPVQGVGDLDAFLCLFVGHHGHRNEIEFLFDGRHQWGEHHPGDKPQKEQTGRENRDSDFMP